MQVRAGGPAGIAGLGNQAALRHFLADTHVNLVQMRVQRGLLVGMLDDDHIAIARLHAGKAHRAVRHRHDGSSDGGAVIHTGMRATFAKHGVDAVGRKAAGNDGTAGNRRGQVGQIQALAFGRVVLAGLAAATVKQDSAVRAALHLHPGIQHAAKAQHLSIHSHALVGHGQVVALACILFDIGYRIKDVQHLGGNCGGYAGSTGRLEILASERDAGQLGAHFGGAGLVLETEAIALAAHGQFLIAARLARLDPAHAQGLQALVRQHFGLDLTQVLAQHFATHGIGRTQIAFCRRVADAQTGQQAGCRVVLAGFGIAVEDEVVRTQIGFLLAQGRGGLHHFEHLADYHIVLLVRRDHGKGTTGACQHQAGEHAQADARVLARPCARLACGSAQRTGHTGFAVSLHFACLFGFNHQFLTTEGRCGFGHRFAQHPRQATGSRHAVMGRSGHAKVSRHMQPARSPGICMHFDGTPRHLGVIAGRSSFLPPYFDALG